MNNRQSNGNNNHGSRQPQSTNTGNPNTGRRQTPLNPSHQSGTQKHSQNNGSQTNPQSRPQSASPRRNPPQNHISGGRAPYNQNPYNPPAPNPIPKVKHRSLAERRRSMMMVVLTVIILVMLLISVIVFAARCATGANEIPEDSVVTTDQIEPVDSTADTNEAPPETTSEPDTTALPASYEYKSCDLNALHTGHQILVNYQNAFVFESTDFKLKTFYGNKNLSYKVSNINVSFEQGALNEFNAMMEAFEAETGAHDLLVNSSYRTFDEQEEIYSYRVDQYGEQYAASFVAVPGFSEHHTGLAVDLTVYTDNKESKTLDDFPDYQKWLNENAHRFGFILRYPEDKIDITKIGYENWHYRYVGKPHAYYMYANNLCYEEYIELLRGFTFDDKHLKITDDEGQMWEIYFVKAVDDITEVPVPKYDSHTLSGNNVDGFIVTVKR